MQHVIVLDIHIFSTAFCGMDDWHPKRERLRNGAAFVAADGWETRWLQQKNIVSHKGNDPKKAYQRDTNGSQLATIIWASLDTYWM